MSPKGVLAPALAVVVLVLVASPVSEAVLAAMSVDFGSQFMKIGLVKPGVPMEIVLNRESRRKTPSMVSIRNEERLFSDAAAVVSVRYPKDAYVHLLELLGKKLDNPMVQLFHKRFPFYNLRAEPHRGTVLFEAENGDTYSPEVLVAMVLSDARKVAEAYAEQPVKDCVITVPPYFNQAERRAMAKAAEIAGVNLLQLLNDNTAAGINYGMFRRKEFNESSTTMLVFDMGAAKTTATVFEFQLVKDKGSSEKNPQMSVLGVGFDRTLGGLEMSLRMRDRLLSHFQQQHPDGGDITENARSMAKLLKEAERVKQVLSANADHFAQIENLFEDRDFRAKVTRQEFEEMCADVFDRVEGPVKDALKMAELDANQIDSVVIMGAGTRTPKVQEKLQQLLGVKELGKFLNTDEAIALGAVYQAAHLSKGFKVKKFNIKEANLFPIQVDFMKENTTETEKRLIHRTLFGLKNPYPQKKVMTFSKHIKDFEFSVNYGDLKHLSQQQLSAFGELNITRVDLDGVADAYLANNEEGAQYKGVKAHFRLDDSGILILDYAELVVEKIVKEEQSTLSAIGSKLRGLFSSSGSEDEKKEGEKKDEETKDEKPEPKTEPEPEPTESKEGTETEQPDSKQETQEEEPKDEKPETEQKEEQKEAETPETKSEEKKPEGKTEEKAADASNATTAANETKKAEPQPSTVRVPLKVQQSCMDITNMTKEEHRDAVKRLSKFDTQEKERAKREQVQNTLESFVFENTDKLEQTEYQEISTEEEREQIRTKLKEVGVWMEDEADINTKTEDFESRLKSLKDATKDLTYKFEQAKERPQAIEALNQMLNHSTIFLAGIRNLTEELQIFTKTEIETLEKVINDTEKWWKDKQEEQAKLATHEKPVMTILSVAEKINALDREVKYLLNKAKRTPPPKPKNDTTAENKTEESKADKKKKKKKKKDKKAEEEQDDDEPVTSDEVEDFETKEEKDKEDDHGGEL